MITHFFMDAVTGATQELHAQDNLQNHDDGAYEEFDAGPFEVGDGRDDIHERQQLDHEQSTTLQQGLLIELSAENNLSTRLRTS